MKPLLDFLKLLISLALTLGAVAGFLFLFVAVVGPYFFQRNVADAIKRANSPTRVWLDEQNMAIFSGKISPPFPFVDCKGTNAPVPECYACVGSIKEAEDWLLRHGYKKWNRWTSHLQDSESEKEFFIRNVPHTKAYSYVCLLIDYGDYDIRMIPYQYPKGKSPVDFSRFQEEDWSATGGPMNTVLFNNQPPLPWKSTDSYGSHTFGRETSSNHDEVDNYDWDRYVRLTKE
jgi:hypothetical protein